eukprot:361334-Chlamydomonas_euryale.AAC.2
MEPCRSWSLHAGHVAAWRLKVSKHGSAPNRSPGRLPAAQTSLRQLWRPKRCRRLHRALVARWWWPARGIHVCVVWRPCRHALRLAVRCH